MHGEAIGIGKGLGVTPSISLAYAMVAGFLYFCARSLAGASEPKTMTTEPHGKLEPAE
jgi:AGZA family xanthine/uracil permease-like MFS transporter